jgi:hypothetical protein
MMLCSGQLSGQGLPHSAFLLPGEGRDALTLLGSGLDGGDGGGQREVGRGRRGSPSDVGDWATSWEARGRRPGDSVRRRGCGVNGECEGTRVRQVAWETKPGCTHGGSRGSGCSSSSGAVGGRSGHGGSGGEGAAGGPVGSHGGVGDVAAKGAVGVLVRAEGRVDGRGRGCARKVRRGAARRLSGVARPGKSAMGGAGQGGARAARGGAGAAGQGRPTRGGRLAAVREARRGWRKGGWRSRLGEGGRTRG